MNELDNLIEQGKQYFDNNELDKAIQVWENAVNTIKKNKEQHAYIFISIADAYFKKNDYDKAIEYYKLNIKKTNNFNEKNLASFRIGQAFFEKGEMKKALKEFSNVYILGGKDIFDEEDEKYFNFFSEKILLNPKKSSRLVSNFMDIIGSNDFEMFKRVFDICKIDAEYYGHTAFYYYLDCEKIKFLINNGLDPNADCGDGYPAIAHQSSSIEKINLLREYGADINIAMIYAIENYLFKSILNLIECGADFDKDQLDVEEMLIRCRNVDIVDIVKLVKIKFEEGLEITPKMKRLVKAIGERFEFYRDAFDKKFVNEYSNALNELYKIFDVESVPRRSFVVEKITVQSKTWQKQHGELWDMLVPGSGFAPTLQGELIRIIGKVLYEILDNGGLNWDEEYEKMIKSIPIYISKGNEYKNDEIKGIIDKISPQTNEEDLFLLNQLIVEWILQNPNIIKLDAVEYER